MDMVYGDSYVFVAYSSWNRNQKMLSKEQHWAKHQVKHHYNAFIFCILEFIPFNYELYYVCG